MATRPRSRTASSRHPMRQTASWLALLASTTLGAQSSTILAEIQFANVPKSQDSNPHRLIVQVYPGSLDALSEDSRPSTSTQRIVTLEELRRGVSVPLVDVRAETGRVADSQTVVAWVEAGEADLELGALRAKPHRDGPLGTATVSPNSAHVQIELRSRAG